MKSNYPLLLTFALLVLGATLAIPAQHFYVASKAAEERDNTVAWEKRYARESLVYDLASEFKKEFEALEDKTGQKADSLGVEEHPKVFTHRLSRTKGFGGENLEEVHKDIHFALLQVLVLSEQIGDKKLNSSDEIRQVLGNHQLNVEAYAKAQARLDAIDNRIKDQEQEIEKMTWESVPPARLQELRQMGRLKYN